MVTGAMTMKGTLCRWASTAAWYVPICDHISSSSPSYFCLPVVEPETETYLVGGIAVLDYTVRADNDTVDIVMLHQRAQHRVTYTRHVSC